MGLKYLILIGSFILTFFLSLVIIPYLKKLHIGQIVRSDGPESHLKKSGTPTMGGIMILITLLFIGVILSINNSILWLVLIAAVGSGIVGAIDDYKKLKLKSSDGISPKVKMILLFLIGSIFIILSLTVFNIGTDILVPFINDSIVLSLPIYVIFMMIVFLGTTNAINITDGLDGLAGGIVAIIMGFFTCVAIRNSDTSMSLIGCVAIGSVMAFLIFNIKPAKVFMGDTGSLMLGGLIASVAIIMKMPLYLLIVALVPVVETLSTALQVIYFKLTKGKRIFKMAPLHHHLELSGYGERKIVIVFWSITAVLAILGFFV